VDEPFSDSQHFGVRFFHAGADYTQPRIGAFFQKYSGNFRVRSGLRTTLLCTVGLELNPLEVDEMESNSAKKRAVAKLGGLCAFGVLCLVAARYGAAAKPAANAGMPAETMKAAALPVAGTYKIDSNHSFAYFGARHHVVGLVRGRFDKVTGTIVSGKDPAACSVDVAIDLASVSTQNTKRDEDLRSDAYFDVTKFPTMTYRGSGIHRVSRNMWVMDGSLTLHGVTKVVPLTFTFNGVFPNMPADAPARAAFHATAGVKRAEFGIGARDNLDELGMLQTPDVQIEIDVEADANSTKM